MFSRCRWRVSAGSLDLNAHRYLAEACLAAGQVDATRREADRYRVLIEAAKKQRALRFATPQRRTPKDQLPRPAGNRTLGSCSFCRGVAETHAEKNVTQRSQRAENTEEKAARVTALRAVESRRRGQSPHD